MSKNAITARIEYSFKGEDYEHTTVFNLDLLLTQYAEFPVLYSIMAAQHGIDTYSYLYEVMQESDIEFTDPHGYARDYVVDGEFDVQALADNWQNQKAAALLQPIASRELGIENLNDHPALKSALLAAYNLGRGA
ncbi:MAG: hypothetical protein WCK93_04895 [Nitrosomonadales bacterium]